MASYIKVEEIKDGLVLAEDIHNRQGVLLFSKGMQLSEKHRLVFLTKNISGILVESQEKEIEFTKEELTNAKLFLVSLLDFECRNDIEIDLFTASVICIAANERKRNK